MKFCLRDQAFLSADTVRKEGMFGILEDFYRL